MADQHAEYVRIPGGVPHHQRCDSLRCACYQDGIHDEAEAFAALQAIVDSPAMSELALLQATAPKNITACPTCGGSGTARIDGPEEVAAHVARWHAQHAELERFAEEHWRRAHSGDQAPHLARWDSSKDAWLDGFETGYEAGLAPQTGKFIASELRLKREAQFIRDAHNDGRGDA